MSDFQLGQRVAYSTQLKRRVNEWSVRRLGEVPQRQWTTIAYGDTPLRGGEGVVIGKRTLSNGNVIRGHYAEGEGDEYIPSEHFTAYLIAYDLRRKPVHVLPEHITALEEGAVA